ncbi:MAG TPA: hypothetical protein VGS58_17800, partial [Candidatus Sulfopaludibacter sp.]|nr:hypothetical protein [Candidatus Sulfopaludibacter sp.]
MTRKLPLLLCAACTVSFAQSQATLAGPVAGFVFDQSARAIRPMIGVAGAAYLGPAVVADLDAAAIAPDGNSALVVRGGRMF